MNNPIYLVEASFKVTKNKRFSVVKREMVAGEIDFSIFDNEDLLARFKLRENEKNVALVGIKKLQLIGYTN